MILLYREYGSGNGKGFLTKRILCPKQNKKGTSNRLEGRCLVAVCIVDCFVRSPGSVLINVREYYIKSKSCFYFTTQKN